MELEPGALILRTLTSEPSNERISINDKSERQREEEKEGKNGIQHELLSAHTKKGKGSLQLNSDLFTDFFIFRFI